MSPEHKAFCAMKNGVEMLVNAMFAEKAGSEKRVLVTNWHFLLIMWHFKLDCNHKQNNKLHR